MFKLVTVIGARPQFIKAAMVSKAIAERAHCLSEILIHTGQHYDKNMSKVFFTELGLEEPAYNLGINGGSHSQQTGNMMIKLEELLLDINPDGVIVFGDTNSTIAAALAGAKLNLPVFHVEAGLRSYNRQMPEEINRLVTDQVSSLLFAPTKTAMDNLANEGYPKRRCIFSGDVMLDAANFFSRTTDLGAYLPNVVDSIKGNYVLLTFHRAELLQNSSLLRMLVEALVLVSIEKELVCPLHPHTRKVLEEEGLLELLEKHITVIPPQSYLSMLSLIKEAEVVVTDSGGLQKEAFFNSVRCVTLRGETEWTELVESGWNTLANFESKQTLFKSIIEQSSEHKGNVDCYGNGNASGVIADSIFSYLSSSSLPNEQ